MKEKQKKKKRKRDKETWNDKVYPQYLKVYNLNKFFLQHHYNIFAKVVDKLTEICESCNIK